MTKTIYKGKKIDAKTQKKAQKLKTKLEKKTEIEAIYHHKLVMVEVKE